MLEKGLVQVYTGKGKGKTTASLGLAFRAAGQGLNVFMIQFLKADKIGGEHKAAKILPNISIEQYGAAQFYKKKEEAEKIHREKALEGLKRAREVVMGEEYDMVILDEINVVLDYNLIPLEEILKLIGEKPQKVELVLTGRNAPSEIIEQADLASEITMVKHPFSQGIKARKGIEY